MFVDVLQETILREQVEGLVEEETEEAAAPAEEEEGDMAVGAITLSEKKTERQRKKEKAEKIKVRTCTIHTSIISGFFVLESALKQVTSMVITLNPWIHHSVSLSTPLTGAAAAVRQTADQPTAAALPASLHKSLHQTAGPEDKGAAETTQGQAGGPESPTKTPRQTQVCTATSHMFTATRFRARLHSFYLVCRLFVSWGIYKDEYEKV